VIKFKGGHSEKIPTPTIDKEPKFKGGHSEKIPTPTIDKEPNYQSCAKILDW
jgi:hypothetical protein